MMSVSLCPTLLCRVIGNTFLGTIMCQKNYSSVQLCYGPCNLPQSQWATVEVTDNSHYTLTGLAETVCYKIKVRAFCDTSKTETPWCSPITFYTGHDTTDTDTTGIHTTALSQFTFLVPNPAKDEVTISSSFGLREIDIWSVDGVCVHHQASYGHRATVDIGFLRAGTYIVAIRTHNGTTHKKLLVQR